MKLIWLSFILDTAQWVQEKVSKFKRSHATTIARVIDGKIFKEGDQILIGGNANYIPLCRKHYKVD